MTRSADRPELLKGTLDMLILRTLLLGAAHGRQIAKHIERSTDDVLRVDHGSLYPALHRLVKNGWITAEWKTPKDRNREFKFYSLTPGGRRQLRAEESKWNQLARAIGQVMRPVEGT